MFEAGFCLILLHGFIQLLRTRFWWTKDEEKVVTIKIVLQVLLRNTFKVLAQFLLAAIMMKCKGSSMCFWRLESVIFHCFIISPGGPGLSHR